MAEASARILVVDDDADIRNLLRARLEAHHYRVRVAENGEAAIAAIAAEPPDLVISDWMMPGIDGLAFVEAVRNDPLTAPIPIILLTARGTSNERSEGLEAGADDYLAKPIEFRELLARIRALLRRSRSRAWSEPIIPDLDDNAGFIAGVPLATVLQMLQMDRRSCRLDVSSPDGSGSLTCDGGQLIDAVAGDLQGQDAAFRILGWRAARVAIRDVEAPSAETTIRIPLAHLLLESVRLDDERDRASRGETMPEFDDLVPFDPAELDGRPSMTSAVPNRAFPIAERSTARRSVQRTAPMADHAGIKLPTRDLVEQPVPWEDLRTTSGFPPVRLVFTSGYREGDEVLIHRAETSLGRAPDNDIVVETGDISRHHARIERSEQGLRVVDLDSTNGTRVNGKAVRSHPIRVGDEIIFGTTKAYVLAVANRA